MNGEQGKIGPHTAGVLQQSVDDELILFDSHTDSYFTLNRTAREVWELSDGTRTAGDIASIVAARYDMEPGDLLGGVPDIIQEFRHAKLI